MASRNLVTKDRPSFKQQNLPAWQPILTAGTVLPTFFLIGVAFVPIGIGLLMSSWGVQEFSWDYTDCSSSFSGSQKCADIIAKDPNSNCECNLTFTIEQDFSSEIYVYYGLSNFYQNHRRYVRSRDDLQLLGDPKHTSSECFPFEYGPDPKNSSLKLPIAPCGAIANSMFNDTFKLRVNHIEDQPLFSDKTIELAKEGIAWSSDKRIRFQNPSGDGYTYLKDAFANTTKPPNWSKYVYELGSDKAFNYINATNSGFLNEDLIVWMRTAALPTFRKLYGIVITKTVHQDLDYLPKGKYSVSINYRYPVSKFQGRKRFIISNTSWLGGKNNFLGIAYIIVGLICFTLSAFFLFIHKKYGRLPSEITQINQRTPYLDCYTRT